MKVHKRDVAVTQLSSAISAYNAGQLVEALTLAGAAEEIFGCMCKRIGVQSAVELIADLEVMGQVGQKREERITYLNASRNCLKHASNPAEDEFEFADLDAFIMTVRAIANARAAGIELTGEPLKFQQKHQPSSRQ